LFQIKSFLGLLTKSVMDNPWKRMISSED